MRDCRVIVDFREAALLSLLPDAESASLPVGDVLVLVDGAPALLLERKSLQDLAASIKDGRWRDQTRRLQEASEGRPGPSGASASASPPPRPRAGVVVEGGLDAGAGGLSASALSNALLSAAVRRGLLVFRSAGVEETAGVVGRACRCLSRPPRPAGEAEIGTLAGSAAGPSAGLPGAARTSRGDRDPRKTCAAMLSVVPGVSPAMALAVMGDSGCLAELVRSLGGLGEAERVNAMSAARHGASRRRVGDAAAGRLNALLFGGSGSGVSDSRQGDSDSRQAGGTPYLL